MIVDQLMSGINSIMHPGAMTKQSWSIREALRFYYLFSIVPLVLAAVLLMIFPNTTLSALVPASVSYLSVVGVMLFSWWVLTPIVLLLEALLVHLVGKNLLQKFSNDYSHTATAFFYSILPSLGLVWVGVLPTQFGFVLVFIAAVWGLVMQVYALSNQQNVGRGMALAVLLLGGIVIGLILTLLLLGVGFAVLRH